MYSSDPAICIAVGLWRLNESGLWRLCHARYAALILAGTCTTYDWAAQVHDVMYSQPHLQYHMVRVSRRCGSFPGL